MTTALQSYADRGVFRGFRASPAPGGRIRYQFAWLTRRPMTAAFNSRTGTLTFPALLPDLTKAAAADVTAVMRSLSHRSTPLHKRLDQRRATIAGTTKRDGFTLAVGIRGANHAYAVKAAVNLINAIFVTLQERHPEYLIEHFGVSAE